MAESKPQWIAFDPPDEPDAAGRWVKCPRCDRAIRNLRMAKAAHASWHFKQDRAERREPAP